MYSHASMNRIFRLVWNDVTGTWVAVSEFSRGRVKRSGRAARRLAALLTASAFAGHVSAAPPVLAPNQLPTAGTVAAGSAALRSAPGAAVLNVDQATQRAVIDWGSFNIGSGAQVNFNQPGTGSVTLNRVLGGDASQIAGRITAPGQVFLSNPNGVLFGKTATVDVGGLTATTLGISNADLMAGKTAFANAGGTGAVVNEGLLRANLGGYIALLAPEVRNQGVVIARMGTVALAAGDAVSLDFDGNGKLAGITVQAAALKALVQNQGAVLAPGGLIVLSAQALDRLQGGVVNNSGRLEATGLSAKAGRIVLEASDRVENSGSVVADAAAGKATGGPAGEVAISALDIVISGTVSVASILGHGGSIVVQALGSLRLTTALLDASGGAGGGDIHLQGGATPPTLPAASESAPSVIVEGGTRLRVDSAGAFGGRVAMTADSVFLLDETRIDAGGATGGGTVQVGGGWQGSGGLAQARRVTMAEGAVIDASATQRGDGGTISLWSDVHRADSQTAAHGTLQASGGSQGGDGGDIETSGHWLYVDRVRTRAAARSSGGRPGQWLLDPYDVTISTATTANVSASSAGGTTTYSGSGTSSNLAVSTITSALNGGTNVTVSTGSSGSAVGDITVSNAIAKTSGATDVTLTLKAANTIIVNADVTNAGGTGNAGKLNIALDADNDNGTRDGAGIVILNAKLSTNGGSVAFGTGATMAINGTTTKVGGDVYVGGTSAQTINTSGGAVTVNGEMIIANTAGLSINTAGGNVSFGGLLNSGDTYTLVNNGGDIVWTSAYAAAKGSTSGAAAVGDTYLATITSRLENAVASRTANYTGAWLGARRGQPTATATNTATPDDNWRWIAGPEGQANGGTGLVFFNGATTSGSAPSGAYTNWSSGEPNNSPCSGCGANESALQFTGTQGRWNDYWPGAGQTGVTTYLRETNVAGSPLAINAGAGTVTFSSMVGGSKALASLNITAGTVAVNGGGVTSEGLQTYNAAVTLGSAATVLTQTNANTDFTLPANRTISNATAANASLTISTTGGIVLAKGSSIGSTSGALTTVLGADSDASGAGYIWLQGDGTTGATISSNGAPITLSGGANPATGYAAGGSTGNSNGVTLDTATLNSAGGAIVVRGKGSATVASYTGSEGTSTNSDGIRLFGSNTINAGSGTVALIGVARATDNSTSNGIESNAQGYTKISSSAANTTAITIAGDASAGTASNGWGTFLWGGSNYGIVLAATGSNGGISIDGVGRGGVANAGGTQLEPNSYVLASGPIAISGTKGSGSTYAGVVLNGSVGYAASLPSGFGSTSPVTASSGNIGITTDSFAANNLLGNGTFAGSAVQSSGTLSFAPRTAGKALTVQNNDPGGSAAWFNPASMFGTGGLVKTGFSNVVFGSSGAGTVTLDNYAFDNDTQLATGSGVVLGAVGIATRTLTATVTGSGSITDTGNVAVSKLALNAGSSAVTLDSAGNAIGTVAANVASLALTNASALTVGSAGSLTGIAASGNVAVSTLSGDLTLAQNIASSSTGASAVVLNAGQSAAAGTTSGGNILRPGSATVTTGSGGRATLMTGSIAGSTGLVAYAGSGSGRFRYGSDETTTAYTTALASGLDVIYREQPLVTVTANAASKVYDGAGYSGGNGVTTSSSYVNGDTSASTTGTATYGGSAQSAIAAGSYTITPGGLANGLGYGFTYVGAALTINPRVVTLTGSRAYDGTANIAGSALGVSNRVGSDTLTLSGSGTLASKTVGSRAIASTGSIALGGASAANYTLAGSSGTVTLTAAPLTVTAPAGATKTYDGTTNVSAAATVGTLAGAGAGDVVSGAALVAYADANAGTGKTVQASGLHIRDSANADVTSNYAVTYVASNTGVVNPAPLTVKANADSRFVSQTDTAGFDGASYAGFVGSEGTGVLGGTLAISRPNAGTDVAVGTYTGALVPSGVTASNYTITFANGNYTIVPADQLLVKVTNTSVAYGSAPSFGTGVSASYQDSNSSTINTLTLASHTGNAYTFNDGAGGTISFTLSPQGAVNSTAGQLKVGNYAVADASAGATLNGTFNALTFAGNVEVTRAALVPTASNVSKVYDGTTAMNGVTLGLNGQQVGDVVTVSGTGAFSQKNVGTGLGYSINGLSLGGADANNYFLNGGSSFSGSNGAITAATLQVSGLGAISRTYDTTTVAALSGTAGVAAVPGDTVNLNGSAVGSFANKTVGAGKAVTVSGLTLTGADAGNYTLAMPTGLTASVTPATLAVSGTAAVNKVYNATTAASLSGTAVVSALTGDSVTLGGTGVASFANKNVGTGKAVTVSGYTLSGTDAGNYTLVQPAGLTASITPATLTAGGNLAAAGKVYDTNTVATLTGASTVTGFGGDVVSIAGSASGSFADKNVGANKAVTVSGLSLGGADAGNYTLVLPSLTAAITPASLAVGGSVAAIGKTYDATAAASLSGTAAVTALAGDAVTLGGAGVATFANKNVGTNKAVTVSGYTLGGTDAGNYTLVQPAGLTASITAATLTAGGNLAANGKVYNASTVAALTGAPTVTGIGGDVVTIVGSGSGSFADKNVGTNKAVTVGGYTVGGADAGNYTLVLPSLNATITPALLTVGGTVAAIGKTYDATVAASLSGTAAVTAIAGDVVALGGAGTASFANKNVGTNKAVTVSGYTLSGTDAGNYTLVQPAGLTASITAATLTAGGNLAAVGKVYDANTAAALTGAPTVGGIGGDVVSIAGTGSGSFGDKNVGTNKAVTVGGYSLSGADAGNYTLSLPTLTAAITPAQLLAGGNVGALGKTYDATTVATLTGAPTVSAIGSDVVSIGGTGVGTFANKNVGANKAVTVSGFTLSGADAGNYTLVEPTGVTATITPATLLAGGNVGALGKTYDATTVATLTGAPTVTAIGSDVVSIGGTGVGTFANKNVGTNKAVTVSGFTLSGADAGNYTLVEPTGVTATITRANLVVGGNVGALDKTYDATTAATLTGAPTVSAIGSDAVSIVGTGVGTFANKNVGTNKAVTVSGFALSGADAGNYTLVEPTGVTATITPAALLAAGGNVTAASKIYDATTGATLSGAPTVTAIGSDVVGVGGTGVGTFADKNVGANKAVTVTGFTLTGADAGNYSLVEPTGVTATITPANLLAGGNVGALGKTYDATTVATLTGAPTVAAIGSDVVSIVGTGVGTFANKNVGTNKAVTVSGYTLSGADAGNYTFVEPTGVTATITPANLLAAGGSVTAANKIYDATTFATLSGAPTVTAIGSDIVGVGGTGVGTFADKNVGANKAVTVTGFTLTGADAANYTLVEPTSVTATITPANLLAGGNVGALGKTYDATTVATLSGAPTVTAIGSDVVGIGGTGVGTFIDKNVGTNKVVTVSGFTLTGADAGNYTLAQLTGVTANITPANLPVAAGNITAADKTYDATTVATLAGAPTVTAIGSDVVNVGGTGVGSFADKNVGTNKAVTISGFTLTGADAGNYSLVEPTGVTATITPARLLAGGNVAAANKTYDATTAATLTGAPTVTAIGSDVVSVGGTGVGTFGDKNVGTNKAVTVSGFTLTGADAGNYSLVEPTGVTATITPARLLVAAGDVTALDKTYDATALATLAGAPAVTAIGNDLVNIGGSGVGSFADKNVGANKAVTVAGFTLTGADAGNYALVLPTLTATITPAALVAGGNVAALDKIYDATTVAALTGALTVSAIGSDSVGVGGTGVGNFADKNVGSSKAVTVSGFTLTGADAGNYTLVEPTGVSATITPASLLVGGNIVAIDRTYDATTVAALSGAPTVAAIGSDVVRVGGIGVGSFADKNAGRRKAVTVTGFTLTGADAGNYTLVEPTGLQADITPRALGVTATAAGKVYDGSTRVGVTLADDRIAGDALTLGYGSAALADKNAGTSKAVNINGISLTGADAGNYSAASAATTSADVARAALQVTASGVAKTYDATTAAAVTLSDNRVAGDVLVLTYGNAQLVDKNAGSGKAVTVAGISVSGTDAGNYSFNSGATTTADVAKATLTAGAIVQPRLFDGSAAATVTLTDNRLAGDQLVLGYAAAGFADAAIGTGKPVSVTGIRIAGGADQANYTLVGSGASAAGDILPPLMDVVGAMLPPVLAPVAPAPVKKPPPPIVAPVFRPAAAGSGDTGAVVSVALTRPASAEQSGIVMVSVPKPILSAGTGFSFPMPTEMAQTAGADNARVTLVDGTSLPQWLTFSAAGRSFTASIVPAGALPIEVLVRIGSQEWTVMVTER